MDIQKAKYKQKIGGEVRQLHIETSADIVLTRSGTVQGDLDGLRGDLSAVLDEVHDSLDQTLSEVGRDLAATNAKLDELSGISGDLNDGAAIYMRATEYADAQIAKIPKAPGLSDDAGNTLELRENGLYVSVPEIKPEALSNDAGNTLERREDGLYVSVPELKAGNVAIEQIEGLEASNVQGALAGLKIGCEQLSGKLSELKIELDGKYSELLDKIKKEAGTLTGKTALILAANWVDTNDTNNMWTYTVTDPDVKGNGLIECYPSVFDTINAARDLVQGADAFDGYFKIYALSKPKENFEIKYGIQVWR